jgi:acyl-homoserine-lactone acylase
VQRSLADAVRFRESDDTARIRRWAGITLHGCPEEKGCFNAIEASGPHGEAGPPPSGPKHQRPADKPAATSFHGASFIMAVELTSRGPRARTILTYSQSANPASAHYRDQTLLFSRKQWVTGRFTEAEINADSNLQTETVHD